MHTSVSMISVPMPQFYPFQRQKSFCHSPVDICASARARVRRNEQEWMGVSVDRRGVSAKINRRMKHRQKSLNSKLLVQWTTMVWYTVHNFSLHYSHTFWNTCKLPRIVLLSSAVIWCYHVFNDSCISPESDRISYLTHESSLVRAKHHITEGDFDAID